MRHGLDQPQSDLGGDTRVIGGEEDLVAERLDQPAAVGRHQVGAGGLERLHQLAQFLLLQAAGQPGEAHQVGEAHGQAAVDHLRVVLGLHDPAGGRGQLAPPDVDQELLQLGQEQLDQGVGDLRAGQAGVGRFGQALQEGVDLPVGEAGGGLAGGPGDLYGHRLAQQTRLDQTRQPPQRQDVGLGQRLDLADVGEAHGAPEAGREIHRHTGGAGRLERRVAAVGAEDELFEADGEGPVRCGGRLVVRAGVLVPRRGGARVVRGHRLLPVRSLRTALPITSRPRPAPRRTAPTIRQVCSGSLSYVTADHGRSGGAPARRGAPGAAHLTPSSPSTPVSYTCIRDRPSSSASPGSSARTVRPRVAQPAA